MGFRKVYLSVPWFQKAVPPQKKTKMASRDGGIGDGRRKSAVSPSGRPGRRSSTVGRSVDSTGSPCQDLLWHWVALGGTGCPILKTELAAPSFGGAADSRWNPLSQSKIGEQHGPTGGLGSSFSRGSSARVF